jgi:hypothetical protein
VMAAKAQQRHCHVRAEDKTSVGGNTYTLTHPLKHYRKPHQLPYVSRVTT